jgi:hypothetical protein
VFIVRCKTEFLHMAKINPHTGFLYFDSFKKVKFAYIVLVAVIWALMRFKETQLCVRDA